MQEQVMNFSTSTVPALCTRGLFNENINKVLRRSFHKSSALESSGETSLSAILLWRFCKANNENFTEF